MGVVFFIFIACWTIIVIRLLAARATLSERTFLAYLFVGMLFGPLALQTLRWLVYGYGWNLQSTILSVALISPALLMLPVFLGLSVGRAYLWTSVADAFLLGFLVGFGFDILGVAFSAFTTAAPLSGLSVFPPFALDLGPDLGPYNPQIYKWWIVEETGQVGGGLYVMSGFAYWLGLASLVFAASLRFLRNRAVAAVLGTLILVACGLEKALRLNSGLDGLARYAQMVNPNGALIPWLALLALLALSLYEARWVARANSKTLASEFQAFTQLQMFVTAMTDRMPWEFLRLKAVRLQRQAEIAQAELAHLTGDESLGSIAGKLVERARSLHAMADVLSHPPIRPQTGATRRPRWRGWQLALGAVFFALVFLMPQFPAVWNFFWGIPGFQSPVLLNQLTVLGFVLTALILWWYVEFPAEQGNARDTGEEVQNRAEKWVLRTCLGLTIVALVYGNVENLYLISLGHMRLWTMDMIHWTTLMLTTFMLLLASGAAATLSFHFEEPREGTRSMRLAALVHNILTVVSTFVIAWSGFAFFQKMQSLVQTSFGTQLSSWFPHAANLVTFLPVLALALAFSFGLFWLLRYISKRAETLIVGKLANVKN